MFLPGLQELLPGIINQLGPESLAGMQKFAEQFKGAAGADDADVPDLVENFDQ